MPEFSCLQERHHELAAHAVTNMWDGRVRVELGVDDVRELEEIADSMRQDSDLTGTSDDPPSTCMVSDSHMSLSTKPLAHSMLASAQRIPQHTCFFFRAPSMRSSMKSSNVATYASGCYPENLRAVDTSCNCPTCLGDLESHLALPYPVIGFLCTTINGYAGVGTVERTTRRRPQHGEATAALLRQTAIAR